MVRKNLTISPIQPVFHDFWDVTITFSLITVAKARSHKKVQITIFFKSQEINNTIRKFYQRGFN